MISTYESYIATHNEETRIISFIGTTPNIGTTLAAIRHSFHIASLTSCRVLYLCLNLKSSKLHRYFGFSHITGTLDELLPSLKSGELDEATFENVLYQPSDKHEVYILFGNQQRELAEQFLEEDFNMLIDYAKKKFHYIILDANSYWDNAGSFVSLQLATQIVVVTTAARSNFQEDYQRWFGAISDHLSLEAAQLLLLVVRQPHFQYQYLYKDIVAETKISPYIDTYFPTSVYHYLDQGTLLAWLLHNQEAKSWCLDSCHSLINPSHLTYTNGSSSFSRLYWPWTKKDKTSAKVGG